MFWIVMVIIMALVIGASVLVGKTLSGPRGDGERLTRQQQMTALKASGAMRNRKESRR